MPSTPRLELIVDRPQVTSGEALPVQVLVHNDGPSPATLLLGPNHPLVFEFTGADGGPVLFSRSRAKALFETLGDRSKPLPDDDALTVTTEEPLAIDDDPAAGSSTPLPPGHYRLHASWDTGDALLISAATPVTVTAPAISRLVSLFCPFSGRQVQLLAEEAAEGPQSLLLRDTGGVRANDGSFVRLDEAAAMQGLALAVRAGPGLSGRWFGWLEDGVLHARVALGAGIAARAPALALALERPGLVECAFQRASGPPANDLFEPGEAVFLAFGRRDGGTWVQPVVARPDGVRGAEPFPIAGDLPSAWLAQWVVPARSLRLAWAGRVDGETRLWVQTLREDLTPADAEPRWVFGRRAPLLALALDPIDDGRSPPLLHALFGPAGPDTAQATMAYVQVPLDAGGAPARTTLLAMPPLRADRWALSPHAATEGLVLACGGGHVVRNTGASPGPWVPHFAADVPLSLLRVASSPRGYWAALAVEPGVGLRCVPDPAFSFER